MITISVFSCKKDDDGAEDNFDDKAQALIDDGKLVDYLKTHYYIPASDNEVFGSIDTILNSEVSLFDDDRLETQNITHKEISYKLYYLIVNQGLNDNPTRYDSVFVKYRGFLLDSTKFDENTNFNSTNGWLSLTNVIQGWKYGFPHFKSGKNVTQDNEPISFEDTGKGVLFFPSGLAYSNIGTRGIGPNESLVFHIDLAIVVTADHDNDGILTKDEDLNNDGEVTDDNTDGDRNPNFIDPDDDGDGKLTKDEDTNGDGNFNNDDADGDGIPDYLDPDTN